MQTEKKIFNSRPIFYGFLALWLAIASTKFLFSGDVSYLVLIISSFALFFVYCIFKSRYISMIVVIFAFLFGVGWYFVGANAFEGQTYENICQVEGRIADDLQVVKNNKSTMAYAVLKDVKINGETQKNINISIQLSSKSDVKVGDILKFEAEVENIKLFTLGSFNNGNYRDNAPYKVYIKSENLEKTGSYLTVDEKLRLSIKDTLFENMGEQYGAVGYAVLFGNKDDVSFEIKDAFKSAGVIHILTVSGLHISFLITLIGWILKKCRLRGWLNFFICFCFLFLYAFMCGFSPSVIRAGIMGLVLLFANLSGKCYDSLNSLGLAGVITLMIFPLFALDVGFLMSYGCVWAIFVISPWLTKLFKKIFPKFIAESFAISISASIGILPGLASIYGTQNFFSFFVNLLVVPLFSVVYPVLFLFSFFTLLLPFMGFMLKACAFGFDIIFKISEFFANTIFVTNLVPISIMVSATAFLGFFLLSKYSMLKKPLKAAVCSVLFVLSATFVVVDNIQKPQTGLAYCFEYGYDSCLLTNSAGKSVFVDIDDNAHKIMSKCNIKEISSVFVLDYFNSDVEYLRSLGAKNIVSCNNYRNYDEELLVEENYKYEIDGFEFEYKMFNKVLSALEISFDDRKILIVSYDCDNAVLSLSKEGYDFVMVGSRTELAKGFSSSSLVLGYDKDENVDKNYLQDGNSFYKINQNQVMWRCLD